jgi:ABC-type transporter Mla maintaining outer membrane lipid asymmetry permease subunit MlaE
VLIRGSLFRTCPGAQVAARGSWLGSMHVTEQIDALRTLATHQVDFLVVPRLLVLHVALSVLLTGFSCVSSANKTNGTV